MGTSKILACRLASLIVQADCSQSRRPHFGPRDATVARTRAERPGKLGHTLRRKPRRLARADIQRRSCAAPDSELPRPPSQTVEYSDNCGPGLLFRARAPRCLVLSRTIFCPNQTTPLTAGLYNTLRAAGTLRLNRSCAAVATEVLRNVISPSAHGLTV